MNVWSLDNEVFQESYNQQPHRQTSIWYMYYHYVRDCKRLEHAWDNAYLATIILANNKLIWWTRFEVIGENEPVFLESMEKRSMHELWEIGHRCNMNEQTVYLAMKYTMYPWSLQANLFMGGKCTFAIHKTIQCSMYHIVIAKDHHDHVCDFNVLRNA